MMRSALVNSEFKVALSAKEHHAAPGRQDSTGFIVTAGDCAPGKDGRAATARRSRTAGAHAPHSLCRSTRAGAQLGADRTRRCGPGCRDTYSGSTAAVGCTAARTAAAAVTTRALLRDCERGSAAGAAGAARPSGRSGRIRTAPAGQAVELGVGVSPAASDVTVLTAEEADRAVLGELEV